MMGGGALGGGRNRALRVEDPEGKLFEDGTLDHDLLPAERCEEHLPKVPLRRWLVPVQALHVLGLEELELHGHAGRGGSRPPCAKAVGKARRGEKRGGCCAARSHHGGSSGRERQRREGACCESHGQEAQRSTDPHREPAANRYDVSQKQVERAHLPPATEETNSYEMHPGVLIANPRAQTRDSTERAFLVPSSELRLPEDGWIGSGLDYLVSRQRRVSADAPDIPARQRGSRVGGGPGVWPRSIRGAPRFGCRTKKSDPGSELVLF